MMGVAEFMWTVIFALVIGGVIGGLARLLLAGKQNMTGWMTIVIGFMAALIGGLIAAAIGVSFWLQAAIQLGLAVIFVGFYSGAFFRR